MTRAEHEEFLLSEERAHAVWTLRYRRWHDELRGKLVEKYGEGPMVRKEQQLENEQ